MKILILGVTGMLGNAIFRYLSSTHDYEVFGTIRTNAGRRFFLDKFQSHLLANVDVHDQNSLVSVFENVRPEIAINCVGLIKQLAEANDPLLALPINAMLPHRLDRLCSLVGTRLIHFSTDCVFSGKKGLYIENDSPDANDLYGKSKLIGEVCESPNTLTLRSSFIGHELNSNNGLIDWFLSQSGTVYGYNKAIFSGMSTVELARIIEQYLLTKPVLHGLYHISAEPIDKMSLLQLVAKEYGKNIEIIPDEKVSIDRSLDSSRFRKITGYTPPSWPDLINMMHKSK